MLQNPLGHKPFKTFQLWAFDEGGAWWLYPDGSPSADGLSESEATTSYGIGAGEESHGAPKGQKGTFEAK